MNGDLIRKQEKDRKKVGRWLDRIKAGETARAAYDKLADEVLSYFRSEHTGLRNAVKTSFMDFEAQGVFVSVNKAAQIRSVLGPYLYQRDPIRTINSKTLDTVLIALGHVVGCYQDWAVREADFAPQARRYVDDGLLRGRGWLQTGFEPDREVITSWYVSSKTVVVDPSVKHVDDANWMAVQCVAPLWVLRERYGTPRWRTRGLKANYIPRGESAGQQAIPEVTQDASDVGADSVLYWKVYSKAGNGLGPGPEEPDNERNVEDRFTMLVIVPGHRCPLYEGDWDVPLWIDKQWPLVPLDFVETLDQLWPESLMGQALSHQKAIDLLSSIALWGARTHGRELFFINDAMIAPEDRARLTSGGPSEVIPLDLSNGMKPQDALYRFDMGAMSPEVRAERDWHTIEFEKVTGVLSVLTGGQETGAQDRSATASAQRDKAANSRLQDLRSRVEEAITRVARNEAIALRLGGLVDSDEVAKACGTVELGFLVSVVVDGRELPIRDRSDAVDMKRGQVPPLRLDQIAPSAAAYFGTPDEAGMAAQQVVMALQQAAPFDPRAAQILMEQAVSVRPVTVQDVWRDTSGMSPKDFAREFGFQIVAGTTARMDQGAKQEYASNLTTNVLPVAMTAGDYNMVNHILHRSDEAFGVPPDEQLPPMQPPAPPQPEEAPGESYSVERDEQGRVAGIRGGGA